MNVLITTIFFILSFPRLASFAADLLQFIGLNLDDRIISKLSIILVVIIIIFWLGVNLRQSYTKLKSWLLTFKNRIFLSLVGLFFFTTFISSTQSMNANTSYLTIIYWLLIFIVCIFLIVYSKLKWRSQLIAIVLVINFIASLVQVLSNQGNLYWKEVSSFFSTPGMVELASFTLKGEGYRILRPSSFMNDPNFLSIYTSICLVFLFKEFEAFMFSFKGLSIKDVLRQLREIFGVKYLYILAFVLGFINLIMTASRTGILIFIIGIFSYIFFKVVFNFQKGSIKGKRLSNENRKREETKIGSKNGQGFSTNVLAGSFFSHLFDRFKFNDNSFFEHLNYANVALKVFQLKPILGIGPGNYPEFYNKYIDKGVTFGTPHSTYLKLLAEVGVSGLFSFFLVLLFIFFELFRSRYILGLTVFTVIVSSAVMYDSLLTPWAWVFLAMIISDTE